MPDATGPSEERLFQLEMHVGSQPYSVVLELIDAHHALAERLKASEAEVGTLRAKAFDANMWDGIQRDHLDGKDVEINRLTADLAAARAWGNEQADGSSMASERIIELGQRNARLTAALEAMLVSHTNLYKSTFGEQSDPDNDLIRLQAQAALTEPPVSPRGGYDAESQQ